MLHALEQREAVYIDGFGDDGFAPTIWMTPGKRIHQCISEELDKIAMLYARAVLDADEQRRRVTDLVGFDLDRLRKSVEKVNGEIGAVAAQAEASDILKPLQPMIGEIARNFVSVRGVLNQYEEIYRGVLAPIQKEGRASLKWTAFWGVAGIIVSTAVSIGLTILSRS